MCDDFLLTQIVKTKTKINIIFLIFLFEISNENSGKDFLILWFYEIHFLWTQILKTKSK